MVQVVPTKDDWAPVFRNFGVGLSQGYMDRSDENAVRQAIMDLGENASARDILNAMVNTKTYSPKAKQSAFQNYLGVEQFEELRRKAQAQEDIATTKNEIASSKIQTSPEKEAVVENFMSQGYTREEAEALADKNVPNSVKQGISRRVEGELARNQRMPSVKEGVVEEVPVAEEVVSTPEGTVVAQQDVPIEGVVSPPEIAAKPKPKKDEWPKIEPPPNTTSAEKEKWRDKNQTFNNKLLKETKDKGNAHANSLIRYNRLSALNSSGKLPEGMGRLVINPETAEPYGVASLLGVVNKETQDFVKTMNDFMVDAKSYFGARVTNFDVQAFKSRLPTLLNTTDGRRLIIEQMKLMEDLQIVHDKELETALKHYGRNASYSDIQKIVDEKTEGKELAIINRIDNLDTATNYMSLMESDPRFKDMKLMEKGGVFKAVPNNKVSEARSKGYTAW